MYWKVVKRKFKEISMVSFLKLFVGLSYNKTVLFFWVGNLFMGEEGVLSCFRRIKARVFSATEIVKIEVLKNNDTIYAVNGHTNMPDFEIDFEDRSISGKEEDFYYLRVTETEGERVWSSPVWVRS